MERYRHYTDASRFVLLLVDVLLIYGAFRVAGRIYLDSWTFAGYYPYFFVIFGLLWWILSGQYANIYRVDRLITYPEKLLYLMRTFLLHATIVLLAVVAGQMKWPPVQYLFSVYSLSMVGVVSGRFLVTFLNRSYHQHVARASSRFVIVGASDSGQELYRFLASHDPIGNKFMGFFSDDAAPAAVKPLVRGRLADLKEFCLNEQINDIYFALPLDRRHLIAELSRFADEHFLSFRIVPDFRGTMRKDVNVYFYDHLPILTIRNEPLGMRTNQVLKRIFDIAFSGLVICTIFPVIMPLLALLIKLDSPGPVFFKQLRPGKHNQLFPCYKLRTMRADHGRTELQATKNDVRVTRVGQYLRKYNLDELPQFFNVLLGHMSVVGPRPNMVSQLEEYSKHIRTYQLRHAVTPGITGYAQVNGYRGETREAGTMEKRVEYDLKYVENWTFGLDLKIIGQTVWNMVRGEKNAY
ncbi:exopolysaccharide biosynthesis polyprenyl glycosylphosphotransferase [Microvirga sp. STR05]|uniref:Exopolysaccharide biosynthesis polyprenyl glycosylphosphotransferase n=1 Tax=Hymenobacter duratus TaxID=2771356 RepID=A0ABR8JLB3_9BACT|nr:exopolysaccharide biosynthesis polyprenyl glycosylphosphotransferase [Hymenobacter duratus]MBD2715329.1 exopolysaccharide biosynthesis polyprenyl glycosylphosphotransferase [Hymenobacter duratus]MBR7950236.1 exopolysaccharide biosynthesis polyprenyl glycosylphosphotransferase [Microvirga sp. STR05]